MEIQMKLKDRFIWVLTTVLVLSLVTCTTVAPEISANETNNQSESAENYAREFEQLFQFIQEHYVDEVDPDVLFQGALKGMFESLEDPYSVYLTGSDMEDFSDTTTGRFGGVGLYISKPTDLRSPDNPFGKLPYIEVIAPIEGTPAYRAGINAGDYIIEVEGESTEDLTIDEVVDRLRGPAGSDVNIVILRNEETRKNVTLTRAIIEVPVERHAIMPGSFGYLRIIQWTPYTETRVANAIKELKSQGMKGLIIDLRGNPGGLLSSVVDVSDLFLSGGTIVSTKSRISTEDQMFNANRNTIVDGDLPIAILIDQGSASASEIFAGALGDRDRAILIGETSYGKGSVQRIFELRDGGFKLTMSRYYTPSGVNIDKVGITPDIEITDDFSEEELEELTRLDSENRIPLFLEDTPNPTTAQINNFIDELNAEGFSIEERYILRLIRNRINRTLNDPPPFDLETDIVLQKAVEELEKQLP
jgi:carboxyl-terminal processing protease